MTNHIRIFPLETFLHTAAQVSVPAGVLPTRQRDTAQMALMIRLDLATGPSSSFAKHRGFGGEKNTLLTTTRRPGVPPFKNLTQMCSIRMMAVHTDRRAT